MKFSLFLIALFSVSLPVANAQLHSYPADEYWKVSDESSNSEIDHSLWQQVLDENLNSDHSSGVNRVNYSRLAANPEILGAYLTAMSNVPVTEFSRVEQFAYWVNVYNAVTLKVVADHYPVSSIRRIFGGWFGTGPWDEELFTVSGRALSLNDIEHRILRPIWQDPRIHFVVNCASIGCPNLGAVALTGENHQTILEAAGNEFLSHPRGVDIRDNRVTLSKIFKWYRTDFGDTEEEMLKAISEYLPNEEHATQLLNANSIRYQYDWDLNDSKD